jgi:MFS family permease
MRTHTPINERPRQNPLHDIAEGIQYVRAETVIGTLILMEAIMSVFGSYQVMMVVFANEVFGVGPAGMGLLQSASGAGSVAGSFGLAILGDVRRKGRLLLISGVVYGLSLLAFALCPWYIAALPILLVVGASDIVFGATRSTMLQLLTPHTMLGRVMSLSSISMRGLGQLGGAQTGAVASIFGVQWAVALGALICAGFTIGSSWRVPLVRNFAGVEASPPPARGERPPDRRSDAEEPVAAR